LFFNPVAEVFIEAINSLIPRTSRTQVATGFVFTLSAMLASQDRMCALGTGFKLDDTMIEHLVRFCAAGFRV
jgi:hypothetical protein